MLAAPVVAQADAAAEAQVAKTLFQQGKVEEAIPHFEKVTELREKDATAWYNLAYANRKAGRFEAAAKAYQRFTQLSPDDPDGYFGLGESLRHIGRNDEAVAAYTRYTDKEKRPSEQKWVEAAKQHIAELQKPAPIALPTPAAPPPKADPSIALAKGDAAFAARDYRAALFAYQDATVADPKNVPALFKAGQAYAKLGHDPEAIEQWNRALQLDPGNAEVRAALAEARERQGELTQAPSPPPAPPAPPVNPEQAKEHYIAGVNLINQRHYADALNELNQSVKLDPKLTVALVARGSANIGLGKYAEAAADYSAAHDADPSLAAPLFGMAEAARGLGQGAKAAGLYRQFAASTAPDATQALKDYALQSAQQLTPK